MFDCFIKAVNLKVKTAETDLYKVVRIHCYYKTQNACLHNYSPPSTGYATTGGRIGFMSHKDAYIYQNSTVVCRIILQLLVMNIVLVFFLLRNVFFSSPTTDMMTGLTASVGSVDCCLFLRLISRTFSIFTLLLFSLSACPFTEKSRTRCEAKRGDIIWNGMQPGWSVEDRKLTMALSKFN